MVNTTPIKFSAPSKKKEVKETACMWKTKNDGNNNINNNKEACTWSV